MYHKQLANCSFSSFLGREQAHLAPKNPPNLTAKEAPTDLKPRGGTGGKEEGDLENRKRSEGSEEALACRLENISHHQLFIHQHNLRWLCGGRERWGGASHPPVVACADVLASAMWR